MEEKKSTLQGVLIRIGRQKAKLKRAKKQGDSELQMQLQSSIPELEKEAEEIRKIEAAGPQAQSASPAPAVPVTSGITPREAEVAVNIVLGLEEALLSAVATQKVSLGISEKEKESMTQAVLISAEKRLSPEAKAKMDLVFLIGAFATPLILALPKALEMRNLKRARPVEKKEEKEETAKPVDSSIYNVEVAGPLPPPVS